MTNLQKHNNSVRDAFDYYINMDSVQEYFVDWCDEPTQPPELPSWVKPGQWIQYTPSGTCYKITRVDKDYAYFDVYGKCSLKHFSDPDPNYIPVTIRPWSFDEARVAMNSNTRLCIHKQYHGISGVIVNKDGTTSICLSGCTIHLTSDLAKNGETTDYQPCGTPVPM